MTITQPQAQALATLLHQLRPQWHVGSLMTLFSKHQDYPFPDLCAAAINVANDPTKQTPGIIFMPGKHWVTPNQDRGTQRLLANLDLINRFREAEGEPPMTVNDYESAVFVPVATGTKRAMAALAIDTSSITNESHPAGPLALMDKEN